jgi:hypothetical protein
VKAGAAHLATGYRDVILLRIAPEIISVLNYSRGFGDADLITFSERDLDLHVSSDRHRWDDNVITDPFTHDFDER